jgi:hypothetical protein
MLTKVKIPVILCAFALLATAFSGCIEFNSVEKSLSLMEFHFCSDIRDMGDYDTHSKTYNVGEQIFMYFELEGFEKRDDGSAQIHQTLTVANPNGTSFVYQGIPIDNYTMIDQSFDTEGKNVLWFDNHLPLVNVSWSKGTYNIKIVVEDKVANRSISYTTNFVIA